MPIPDTQNTQDTNEQFRVFLRAKRTELGISSRELDRIIFGKNIAYTSRFENGDKQMTLETMGRFLEALDYEIQFVKKT